MLDKHPELLQKFKARLTLISAQMFRERAELAPLELAYTSLDKLKQADWQALPFNSYWGDWVRDFLIRSQYQIPSHWNLNEPIALYLPLGNGGDFSHPEALIYVNGQSFTAVDRHHHLLMLPPALKDHDAHELVFDGWTGIGRTLHDDYQPRLYAKPCSVVLIDTDTTHFALHARTVLEVLAQLEKDSPLQVKLISILEKAFAMVDTRDPLGTAFYESVPDALDYIQAAVSNVAAPLDVLIHAAGHAHIDTAWLWRVSQTRRKAMRTFHTALHLMERYPEYHFSQSQPQLYAFVEEDDPKLFKRIGEAIEAGRWEALGGMWVEADCNVTGAESYVRQFLYGRRYFREHFGEGVESPVLWLPDTFGYPATIPQMAKEAGIDYFFTTKLRWNEHNDFPYDTFYWEGLDGTRILSHITPTPGNSFGIATYNAEANAQSLIESWQRMKMKHLQQMALMSYGWGDGGGGPTPEMLDNLSMLASYTAMPQVKQSKVIDFYHALEEHIADTELPVWNGELYLETHQGTLTSQAWIKRANRKTEVALHDVEFLSVQAMLMDENFKYPQAELDRIWKILLINQFHDILPGSSIKEVYDDAKVQFAEITDALAKLRDTALDTIAQSVGGDWIVVNTVDFHRDGAVLLPEKLADNQTLQTSKGVSCLTQVVEDGTLVKIPVDTLRSFEIEALSIVENQATEVPKPVSVSKHHLENGVLRAEFNDAGDLVRLTNRGKELLAEGAIGNQFQFFEDRPLHYDAWNIDPEFENRMWFADTGTVEVVEEGPVRATLKITRKMMSSTITQFISIYADSSYEDDGYRGHPFLEFRTHVDWQERNTLLKVAFPVNVKANEARYHIQWGAVKRPTHRNTRWDAAKYEVAAHHWADLGDEREGITLVNDCKYAYDIKENVMRLTLLKGATYPDKTADLGEHEFTYRLYAREWKMDWNAGYDLNYPLIAHRSTGAVAQKFNRLFWKVDYDGLIIETVKRSENGKGLVLRAYSVATHNEIQQITFAKKLKAAWRVNFLEEMQFEIEVDTGHSIEFNTHPYEIISIYVELER